MAEKNLLDELEGLKIPKPEHELDKWEQGWHDAINETKSIVEPAMLSKDEFETFNRLKLNVRKDTENIIKGLRKLKKLTRGDKYGRRFKDLDKGTK